MPQCPTLYTGKYFNLPGQPEVDGWKKSIADCRRILTAPVFHADLRQATGALGLRLD